MNYKIFLFRLFGLIIIVYVSAILFYTCTSKNTEQQPNQNPLENTNWETEKFSEYKMIKPIVYKTGATDAYGIELNPDEWYIVCARTGYYMLPVKTRYGAGSPSFVENVTIWNKVATIDTVFASSISHQISGTDFQGLINVHSVAILCFKDKRVLPTKGITDEMTIELRDIKTDN